MNELLKAGQVAGNELETAGGAVDLWKSRVEQARNLVARGLMPQQALEYLLANGPGNVAAALAPTPSSQLWQYPKEVQQRLAQNATWGMDEYNGVAPPSATAARGQVVSNDPDVRYYQGNELFDAIKGQRLGTWLKGFQKRPDMPWMQQDLAQAVLDTAALPAKLATGIVEQPLRATGEALQQPEYVMGPNGQMVPNLQREKLTTEAALGTMGVAGMVPGSAPAGALGMNLYGRQSKQGLPGTFYKSPRNPNLEGTQGQLVKIDVPGREGVEAPQFINNSYEIGLQLDTVREALYSLVARYTPKASFQGERLDSFEPGEVIHRVAVQLERQYNMPEESARAAVEAFLVDAGVHGTTNKNKTEFQVFHPDRFGSTPVEYGELGSFPNWQQKLEVALADAPDRPMTLAQWQKYWQDKGIKKEELQWENLGATFKSPDEKIGAEELADRLFAGKAEFQEMPDKWKSYQHQGGTEYNTTILKHTGVKNSSLTDIHVEESGNGYKAVHPSVEGYGFGATPDEAKWDLQAAAMKPLQGPMASSHFPSIAGYTAHLRSGKFQTERGKYNNAAELQSDFHQQAEGSGKSKRYVGDPIIITEEGLPEGFNLHRSDFNEQRLVAADGTSIPVFRHVPSSIVEAMQKGTEAGFQSLMEMHSYFMGNYNDLVRTESGMAKHYLNVAQEYKTLAQFLKNHPSSSYSLVNNPLYTVKGDLRTIYETGLLGKSFSKDAVPEISKMLVDHLDKNALPNVPFRARTWENTLLKRHLANTLQDGDDWISLDTGAAQGHRYNAGGEAMLNGQNVAYNSRLPDKMTKIIRQYDPKHPGPEIHIINPDAGYVIAPNWKSIIDLQKAVDAGDGAKSMETWTSARNDLSGFISQLKDYIQFAGRDKASVEAHRDYLINFWNTQHPDFPLDPAKFGVEHGGAVRAWRMTPELRKALYDKGLEFWHKGHPAAAGAAQGMSQEDIDQQMRQMLPPEFFGNALQAQAPDEDIRPIHNDGTLQYLTDDERRKLLGGK